MIDDEPRDDTELAAWARELGVTPDTMRRMVRARRELVRDVSRAPHEWGLGLTPRGRATRDVVGEYRARTRLQGRLGESFLLGYDPLRELVPRDLVLPGGDTLVWVLQHRAGLDTHAAHDVAANVRERIASGLGRALTVDDWVGAVQEAAWEHGFDAVSTRDRVLDAVRDAGVLDR